VRFTNERFSEELRMEIKSLDSLLGQLRSAAAVAKGAGTPQAPAPAGKSDFAAVLKASIEQVNGSQQQVTQLARDFELGTTNASLPEVMISMQKANISFQQLVQVRNKLVSAYHDIMNMQV
jgi:flagellar hook-basal body complex protein FliE